MTPDRGIDVPPTEDRLRRYHPLDPCATQPTGFSRRHTSPAANTGGKLADEHGRAHRGRRVRVAPAVRPRPMVVPSAAIGT
jgi:hypothetical protein